MIDTGGNLSLFLGLVFIVIPAFVILLWLYTYWRSKSSKKNAKKYNSSLKIATVILLIPFLYIVFLFVRRLF